MKKSSILALVITLLFSYLAHAEQTNFDGLYVGTGIGTTETNFEATNSMNVFLAAIPLTTTIGRTTASSARSLFGNINLGYSKLITTSSFLGIETAINFYSLESSMSTNTSAFVGATPVTRFGENIVIKKSSPSFSVAIKPGVLLTPTTSLYGLAGVELARFKIDSSANYFQDVGGGPITSSISDITYSNKVGLHIGTGIDSYIQDTLKIGLEYNYVYFDKLKSPSISGNFSGASTGILTLNKKIKASSNSLFLKLTYDM